MSTLSGAVIIGAPVASEMIRPFTPKELEELQKVARLNLSFRCPIQVAYPDCLNPATAERWAYREGVLVDVLAHEDEDITNLNQFEAMVNKAIVESAKVIETIYSQKARKGFKSDLDWQQIARTNDRGVITQAIMQVLAIYPMEEAHKRYSVIAHPLIKGTAEKRIERYTAAEKNRVEYLNQKAGSLHPWI